MRALDKQIFAYTATPDKDDAGDYVKFLQAFDLGDGDITVAVRGNSGIVVAISITPDIATEFAVALSTAAFPYLKTGRNDNGA